MTESENTSISRIAVLSRGVGSLSRLRVYHNRYASAPIDPNWMRAPEIAHFKLREGISNSLDPWQDVQPALGAGATDMTDNQLGRRAAQAPTVRRQLVRPLGF